MNGVTSFGGSLCWWACVFRLASWFLSQMCSLCCTALLVSFTFCGSGSKYSFDKNKLGGLC